MNLTASKQPDSVVPDLDSLLQDSYLLVVQLRHGASAHNGEELMSLCVEQVEYVRRQLERGGLSKRSIELISHAQCALLDETMLGCATDVAHSKWASESLQAKFFNRHQAGEFLYEEMREVLREPAPDLSVLTAFQRVLTLGFRGRYREADDPERAQLLAQLNARVAPLQPAHALPTQVQASRGLLARLRLRTPLSHVLAVGLLLIVVWWAMDQQLRSVIAALLPGQA
ncbi:type VI secretion system protein TssL, short form [Pseudomonas sp. LB3P31]